MPKPLRLTAGQRVGSYTVRRPLGAGGMATLYLVHAQEEQTLFALKVIHPHLAENQHFLQMFADEVQFCAKLSHPNVVRLVDHGEECGTPYFVMEYVDGISLDALLTHCCANGVRLPLTLAVSIACSLLEALEAMHRVTNSKGERLGAVHRDVTPSNAMIDRTGIVKLIDFGITKASERSARTSAGTLKGKYAYMSPEQAAGRAVDHLSDVYSLAVVLWEMLAMRPLFSADNDARVLELVRASVVPPLGGQVPEAVEHCVRCALSRDPSLRPESAGALLQQLRLVCPHDPAEQEELAAWVLSVQKDMGSHALESEGTPTPASEPTVTSSAPYAAAHEHSDAEAAMVGGPLRWRA